MPRGVTREYTVTYNGVTMGGSDEKYRITGFTRIRQEPEIGQVEWDVLVIGPSEAAFTANCRDFEKKMSEPWNDFSFKQGNSSLIDVLTSDNTALNPVVTVQKVGTTSDTGRTRRYHCVATWERPANYPNAESPGLRDYDVMVAYTPARRRTVNITGVYTAVTDNLARAQYEAKIAAFATAVLTAVDNAATFEIVEEDASHDINDKTLSFSRIYDEVIFAQGASGVSNVKIVSQSLDVTAARTGAEAHPLLADQAEALSTVTVRYSAWFDKDQTTDLEGEYNTLRPWLISRGEEYFAGTSALALVSENPSFDPVENKITVVLQLQGSHYGGYLEARFVVEDQVDYGLAAVHAWTGKPFDKYIYQAEANALRTIRMTMVKIGDSTQATAIREFEKIAGKESVAGGAGQGSQASAESAPDTDPLTGGSGKWFSMSRRPTADPYKIGIGDTQVTFTRLTCEAVRFWAVPIEHNPITPGGGGGVAGPTTPGGGG